MVGKDKGHLTFPPLFLQKGFCERDNIVHAIPQRRNVEVDDIQPVEQVLAKAPGGDQPFEVQAAGSKHARGKRLPLVDPDGLHTPLLQGAQQARLARG